MEEVKFSFSQHMQDCLLMLSIEDNEVSQYLATFIKPANFQNDIAGILCGLITKYYAEYKCAPKEHFPDLLEEKLEHLPEAKKELLVTYVHKLYELFPNKGYVLDNLSQFVRHTNILTGIVKGAQLVEKQKYDEAEVTIKEAFRTGLRTADDGIEYLTDYASRAEPIEVLLRTEIDVLDEIIGGVCRKELSVMLASTNVGKSWILAHCGKVGLVQRQKILIYTLEMTDKWYATRIDMGITGMGTKDQTILLPHLGEKYEVRNIFEHKTEVIKKLKFLQSIGGRLIIKGMPAHGLTLTKLQTDLDILEVTRNFTPDVLIVDYADLMTPETHYDQLRHDIAAIYRGLRQIALERNCAVITASQSNRASIGAEVVSLKHFAEDIQKANIADLVLSLCQTIDEEKLSKMRIFCCKNRNGVKGFQVENWYSYHIGQFSLASRLYRGDEFKESEV